MYFNTYLIFLKRPNVEYIFMLYDIKASKSTLYNTDYIVYVHIKNRDRARIELNCYHQLE